MLYIKKLFLNVLKKIFYCARLMTDTSNTNFYSASIFVCLFLMIETWIWYMSTHEDTHVLSILSDLGWWLIGDRLPSQERHLVANRRVTPGLWWAENSQMCQRSIQLKNVNAFNRQNLF